MIIHAFLGKSEEDNNLERAVILEPSSDFQDKFGLFMASNLRDLVRSEYSVRLHFVSN